MRKLRRFLGAFFIKDDGPTAVEYAVMLALIIVVCIGTISAVGGNAAGTFGKVFAGGSSTPSTVAGGTAVSSGTYTDTANGNTYNATTGVVTYSGGFTSQFPPGVTPGGSSVTWQKSG